MDETDGRLAPVSYLFGPRPSVSSVPAAGALHERGDEERHREIREGGEFDEPGWTDEWGSDVDDACARLSDTERDVALDAERISLKALARRDLSRRELERALRDGGVDEEGIARECDRLTRVGLLDDGALAQKLVATLQERKALGRTAIAAELTRRLLAPSAIEYALDLVDTGDELARARELARKRATQLGGLDRDAAVRRLSGYLARRGYSGSTVRAAVEEALPVRSAGSVVRFR